MNPHYCMILYQQVINILLVDNLKNMFIIQKKTEVLTPGFR